LCRADNLDTFMSRLSWNLRTSTSKSPKGLSRPLMDQLYHFTINPPERTATSFLHLRILN